MLVRSLICLLVLGCWLVADLLNGLVNKATGRHSQGEAKLTIQITCCYPDRYRPGVRDRSVRLVRGACLSVCVFDPVLIRIYGLLTMQYGYRHQYWSVSVCCNTGAVPVPYTCDLV